MEREIYMSFSGAYRKFTEAPFTVTKKNKKWGKQLRILLNVWIYSLLKYNASAAESEKWILNI